MTAFLNFNVGSGLGNHDGDDPFSTFTKIKTMLQGLCGGGGGSDYLSVTITAASTNDYNPGGAWPTGIARLDINPSTNDITLTGLVAGTDGQQIQIRNTGSTFNVFLTVASGSSQAANQFTGQAGSKAIPAGNIYRATYYTSGTVGWAVG